MEIHSPSVAKVLLFHHKSPFISLIISLILAVSISPATSDFSEIPYGIYCNDFVPEIPVSGDHFNPDYNFLRSRHASFVPSNSTVLDSQSSRQFSPKSVTFRARTVYKTESPKVFKISGTIIFDGSDTNRVFGNVERRKLRTVKFRAPRIPARGYGRDGAGFRVYGYWSLDSGNLCMVGSGVRSLSSKNVVLKLHYPNSSTIASSLINGTFQSLEQVGSVNYFKPVSILGVSVMGYKYSLIDKEIENGGFSVYDGMENMSLGLPLSRRLCSSLTLAGRFDLLYGNGCDDFSCGFLNGSGLALPPFMFLRDIQCLESGKGRFLVGFSNSTNNVYNIPFDPSTTLVAEGAWNVNKKRFDLVACQVVSDNVSFNLGSIGDCSIRLSISFPLTLSLRNRSSSVGKIWRNRSNKNSSQLQTVDFRSQGNMNSRIEGVKYEYTENGTVSKVCQKRLNVNGKKGNYPDGNSADLRFDMMVENKKGQIASGYASPFYVGHNLYSPFPALGRGVGVGFSSSLNHSASGEMNISYIISFTKPDDFELGGEGSELRSIEISAEGIYNSETGILCMIGCRHPTSQKRQKNESLDCDIAINIQYAPLNGKDGDYVKGTIESTRSKSDPLHFDNLKISSNSITTYQAKESIWRMDLEITMVLVSNTLACIFVGLQLFYVKKNPDVLPFISVMMLIVLTLAHMIPLVLNFEAMFLANRKQNVFLGSDGWLEVNEVLVRIITMIAFLLQFRLLQISWSARNGNESQKSLWVSDKKVLYLSLPLYIGGGLIAWFAHLWKSTHPTTSLYKSAPHWGYYQQKVSFWGELKSYAGLVLDGFLLPQIAFNLFYDSTEKALSPLFYVGTTIVRLLPHAYDLYRSHTSPWVFNRIYANPRMDYYSTPWDVSISCCGLLFVFIIFLQQRYGGRFFLPKRFRRNIVYEKVPVASS